MTFYSRTDWGARRPRAKASLDPARVDELFIHYTTGNHLGVEDCASWVWNIQNYHIEANGWSDIAYHFLVCKHGDVFEGRGWGVRGAATYGHNGRSVALCFLGNDNPNIVDVTPRVTAPMRAYVDEAKRRYGKLWVRPHSAVRDTACPGDEWRDWIVAGLPTGVDITEEDDVPLTDEDIDRIAVRTYQRVWGSPVGNRDYTYGQAVGRTYKWADEARRRVAAVQDRLDELAELSGLDAELLADELRQELARALIE